MHSTRKWVLWGGYKNAQPRLKWHSSFVPYVRHPLNFGAILLVVQMHQRSSFVAALLGLCEPDGTWQRQSAFSNTRSCSPTLLSQTVPFPTCLLHNGKVLEYCGASMSEVAMHRRCNVCGGSVVPSPSSCCFPLPLLAPLKRSYLLNEGDGMGYPGRTINIGTRGGSKGMRY